MYEKQFIKHELPEVMTVTVSSNYATRYWLVYITGVGEWNMGEYAPLAYMIEGKIYSNGQWYTVLSNVYSTKAEYQKQTANRHNLKFSLRPGTLIPAGLQ